LLFDTTNNEYSFVFIVFFFRFQRGDEYFYSLYFTAFSQLYLLYSSLFLYFCHFIIGFVCVYFIEIWDSFILFFIVGEKVNLLMGKLVGELMIVCV